MSMSTHAIGLRKPTPEYKKKLAAWKACEAAGVNVPEEILEYFEHVEPNPDGMEVDIKEACSKYNGETEEGLDVDLKKLPKDIQIIRFYNSY